MTMPHPLDRPVWNMLTGRQAHLAEGDARAVRIDRGYGVFGVAADTGPEAQAALAALVPDDGEIWIVEGERWPVRPERTQRLLGSGLIDQTQFDKFTREGAIGSHLENLQRKGGFKGFNQQSVSAIIAAVDPRKQGGH